MPTELFSNDAATTLAAAVAAADTTISVTSSAGFPTAATGTSQFRIRVDNEFMIVTNVSATTWTVTRGVEGSVVTTHAVGAAVTHVVTAESLQRVDHALRHVSGGPDPLYVHFGHNLPGLETFPRYAATQSGGLPNGQIVASLVTPEKNITISQLGFATGNTKHAAATLIRLGLWTYDESTGNATLVAETANDTTIFSTAFTFFTRPLDSARGGPLSYTMERGRRYVFTSLVVGATTSPNARGAIINASLAELNAKMALFKNNQTDHPAIGTALGTWDTGGTIFWGYAS